MRKLFRCIKNFFFCLIYPFWKLTDDWYDYNTCIDDKRKGVKNFFINYNYTWYDDIPHGWKKAFGKQLSKEIKKAGIPYIKQGRKWEDILSFQQIKEKWGELCLYASATKEIQDVLEKYETMSSGYCIICGKPARYITKGWISFVCEKCYIRYLKERDLTKEEINKYKQENRLTKDDISKSTRFEYKTLEVEEFSSEEDCQKRLEELWEKDKDDNRIFYRKSTKEDGTWIIKHEQSIEHVVDYKEEYGIDFEKLWGLK